jgi:signal transduction histidine kinase
MVSADAFEVSRHKCLIYDGHPREQLPVVVPLLREGLDGGMRCLYLGDPAMVEMVGESLVRSGVDVPRERDRKALVLSSDRSHLKDGRFDPRAMVDLLRASIDEALGDGFKGLCATGDMTWELGAQPNFERLLEYEALLEGVFRDKPLMGICQYRRDLVPEFAVHDALITHRSVHIGTDLNRDNLFYVPPEILLEAGPDSARRGEWMCAQITRVLRAERERDRALDEQRRLAERLAALNQVLERRVEERTAALEAANRELEAFSYSVSHDLRAPLRAIDGFAGLLAEESAPALGEEGRRHLDRVRDGCRRMDLLIGSLLALSRVTLAPLARRRLDLGALAREVLDEQLASRGRPPVTATVGALPAADGDPTLLRQVFTNLIGNALKYSSGRPGPRIEVGGRAGERENVYWVADNGAGFEPSASGRLFGVFQRLHSPREFEGVGVGLSIVKRIVERHGGSVRAEGAVEKGATFTFTLPAPGS